MTSNVDLTVLIEADLDEPIGQLRVVPVRFDPDEPSGILCVHSESENIDPYANNFTFPEDTLRFSLFDHEGAVRWRKDLGKGIVPGVWFCPVSPFDVDGDGAEEIWYVDTEDPEHPLSLEGHRPARLDPASGSSNSTRGTNGTAPTLSVGTAIPTRSSRRSISIPPSGTSIPPANPTSNATGGGSPRGWSRSTTR